MAIFGHFCCAVFEAQKRGFYFVDALLFYFVKIHFVDAFLSGFLKIDGILLCRRFSPETTLSTHLDNISLCRRISSEKHLELRRQSLKTEICVD